MEFVVYRRFDNETRVIAHIKNGQVIGEQAEAIKKVLIEHGWPKVRPDRILTGHYVWAAEISPDAGVK